jgi:hypothetical protein
MNTDPHLPISVTHFRRAARERDPRTTSPGIPLSEELFDAFAETPTPSTARIEQPKLNGDGGS